jgi:hypothetical protein
VLKKSVAVFLVFIFFYNISGYYLAFNFCQTRIKNFVQSQIKEMDSEDLILIVLSPLEKNNIQWENNDEFRFKGKMYDVAFRKQENNKFYLYCYNDLREEHLFTSLKKHIKNHIDNSAAQKNSKTILKSAVSFFYAIPDTSKIFCFYYEVKIKDLNIFPLENIFIEFPSPPPKLG